MITLDMYLFMKHLANIKSSVQKGLACRQAGFTLIELLVVIGILGILASALVATIDPFEQVKKGDDAVLKNVATEFQTASLRYYTTHGALAWDTVANGGVDCNSAGAGTTDPNQIALSAWKTTCVDTLIDERELKAAFIDFKDLDDLFVTESDNNIAVCFKPKSASQRKAPTTKYTKAGVEDATNCPAANPTDATECYYCAK